MAEEWPPEAIQEVILGTLYSVYMRESRQIIQFNKASLRAEDPDYSAVRREVKQLEYRQLLEVKGETSTGILCRLTPAGREAYERMRESHEGEARGPMGFQAE